MKKTCLLIIFILFVCSNGYGSAEPATDDIFKAVVRIKATIPKDADSAATLGPQREGNGITIDAEGTILTVGYLVREAEAIDVTDQSGKTVSAKLIAYDYDTGFGLLRTDAALDLSPVLIGQSATVNIGDPVIAIGYGEEAVQAARVASRNEFAGYWEYLLEDAIYTVPPFTNFSGAALINREGKLVGIGFLYTQLQIPDLGQLPCNVFIPIDLLPPLLADLKNTGRSRKEPRPWLGINAAESYGRIFITKVTAGGPAEKAGVKKGDIILAVAGQEVGGLADFYRKIWSLGKAGVEVPLSLLQGIKIRDLKAKSIARGRNIKPAPRKDLTI